VAESIRVIKKINASLEEGLEDRNTRAAETIENKKKGCHLCLLLSRGAIFILYL
jgi:hypothetical protein